MIRTKQGLCQDGRQYEYVFLAHTDLRLRDVSIFFQYSFAWTTERDAFSEAVNRVNMSDREQKVMLLSQLLFAEDIASIFDQSEENRSSELEGGRVWNRRKLKVIFFKIKVVMARRKRGTLKLQVKTNCIVVDMVSGFIHLGNFL